MSVEEEGFVHRLHISNPKTEDMGKYSCDINGVSTSAFLEVEGESSVLVCQTAKKCHRRHIQYSAIILRLGCVSPLVTRTTSRKLDTLASYPVRLKRQEQ